MSHFPIFSETSSNVINGILPLYEAEILNILSLSLPNSLSIKSNTNHILRPLVA